MAKKDIYILFIRSILEFAAPLWTGALIENRKLSTKLDQVQRFVCRIINPQQEPEQTQIDLKLCPLAERRIKLSLKCANKMLKNPKFSHMFKKNSRQASRNFGKVLEPKWSKKRYGLSSVPFFCRLLMEQESSNLKS